MGEQSIRQNCLSQVLQKPLASLYLQRNIPQKPGKKMETLQKNIEHLDPSVMLF